MKALQLSADQDRPALDERDSPSTCAGEIRVRIAACGLNFADLLMIKGEYQETPPRPFTMGLELAGTVDQVGDGVTDLAVGDRVAVFAGQGGLAEYGVFPAHQATPIPDEMPFDEAAGFQVAYGTSHLALDHRARLQPGETLLVLGAAGGVGLTAVEIGKAMGANVIAVARGAEKCAVCREAGADHVIDSDAGDLLEALRAHQGVDVVYDPVGGAQFKAAMRVCKPEARLITIGFASGEVPQIPANILLVKNLTVIGFYWGGYLKFNRKVLYRSLAELLEMYRAGKIRPHISHRFPLERATEALDMLASRKSTGKVVVTMPEPEAPAS